MVTSKRPDDAGARFIDMAGQEIAGVRVISRARTTTAAAHWLCELPCRHRRIIKGSTLRSAGNRRDKVLCGECGKTNGESQAEGGA